MMKRDLKADLEMCNKATPGPWVKDERVGCVAVYPRSIGEINCMGESEGKRIFYKGGYQVLDEDGRFKHWEVHPQDIADAEFVAQAREGWPHAIERALELEEELTRCGNTLVELTIALKDDRKRADKAETLARELVDVLGRVTPRYLAGRLELDLDLVHEANGLLKKAKEVLGDEN